MGENHEPSQKGKLARIGELGPIWITAIAALIVALTGAGYFAGHAAASSGEAGSTTPRATTSAAAVVAPAIHIKDPVGGDLISMTPVITGTVTNLAPGEVVWSFNEPYTTGNSPVLNGSAYPDAGPCRVSGTSFRCNLVFAGGEQDYCRQVRLWVAVVTVNEANDDTNIKEGTAGNTYISLRENESPPHVANAIDHVHVQREPRSNGSC